MKEVNTKTRAAKLSAEKAQQNNLLSAPGHGHHIKNNGMSLLLAGYIFIDLCFVYFF